MLSRTCSIEANVLTCDSNIKNPLSCLRTIVRSCVGHTLNTNISSISLVIKVNLQETNYKTTKVKVNPNTIHIHQHNQDSSKDS